MSIRSDRVCKRPWNFERVPNKQIEGNDKVRILLFSIWKVNQLIKIQESCFCIDDNFRLSYSLQQKKPAWLLVWMRWVWQQPLFWSLFRNPFHEGDHVCHHHHNTMTYFFLQQNFICRSVEYNYVTLQVSLFHQQQHVWRINGAKNVLQPWSCSSVDFPTLTEEPLSMISSQLNLSTPR